LNLINLTIFKHGENQKEEELKSASTRGR